MKIPHTLALACASAVLFLSACSSMPPPTSQLAVADAALARAVSAGATEAAPQEILAARGKLERAQMAMKDKEYERALALSNEVQVDVKLAESKAEAAKARKAADAAAEDARVLREEMDRKSK